MKSCCKTPAGQAVLYVVNLETVVSHQSAWQASQAGRQKAKMKAKLNGDQTLPTCRLGRAIAPLSSFGNEEPLA